MKYLIYKVSGGLNHMLIQINKAIYLSKLTNRFLIIDTNNEPFEQNFNKWFNIPNFKFSTTFFPFFICDHPRAICENLRLMGSVALQPLRCFTP